MKKIAFGLTLFAFFGFVGLLVYQETPPLRQPPQEAFDSMRVAAGRGGVLRHGSKGKAALLMAFPVQPPVRAAALRITSPFGWRLDPLTGQARFHEGIDIAAPEGGIVYAPGAGVVEDIHYDRGYGLSLTIRHPGTGYHSRLAHLSAFRAGLRLGQRVRRGQSVGRVGSSGRSTGMHVHFGVVHEEKGPVDPAAVFEEWQFVSRVAQGDAF